MAGYVADVDTAFQQLRVRQSIESNYCAPYAVGMLLAQAGLPMTRSFAKKLFGARPPYTGAFDEDIERALQIIGPHKPHRVSLWRSDQVKRLTASASLANPLLLSFHILHRRYRGWHAALIVGQCMNGKLEPALRLVDPLVPSPRAPNSILTFGLSPFLFPLYGPRGLHDDSNAMFPQRLGSYEVDVWLLEDR